MGGSTLLVLLLWVPLLQPSLATGNLEMRTLFHEAGVIYQTNDVFVARIDIDITDVVSKCYELSGEVAKMRDQLYGVLRR